MGFVAPGALMAAQAAAGWLVNRKREGDEKKRLVRRWQDTYNNPRAQAMKSYLMKFWADNNLGERLPGVNVDDLLRMPEFDTWRERGGLDYRRPGAGGAAISGLLSAVGEGYRGYRGTRPNTSGYTGGPIDEDDYWRMIFGSSPTNSFTR